MDGLIAGWMDSNIALIDANTCCITLRARSPTCSERAHHPRMEHSALFAYLRAGPRAAPVI
jgi:hypothetical protein